MRKKEPAIELQEQPPQVLEGRVVVMPQSYLPKGKSSGKRGSSKGLFIGLVVALVVAIIGVFAVIYFQSASNQPQEPISEVPVITPPTIEEPEIVDEEPPVVEEVIEEPEEIIEEVTPQIDIPSVGVSLLPLGADTDQDGLTDTEELIFITSAAVPDTDADSFLDGAEVGNLYDPATPGALLEVSPQIKIIRNTDRGYELLAPAAWSASKQTPTGELFLIRPDSGPESFTIQMYENTERLTPVQWYQRNNTSADLNQFNNFINEAGWSGIQSNDSTLVIATFGDTGPGARAFIFVMYYNSGTATTMEYPSIWKMMLQSLAVLDDSAIQSVE